MKFSIERLQAQMTQQGYTQAKLIQRMVFMGGDGLKPTPSYISKVLNGDFSPKLEYLQLLARALDCQIGDLCD